MKFESSSPNRRGITEPKKKLRSIKLSRMSTSNPSAKWVKTRFEQAPVDSVSDDASSEPTQFELSTPSPNHLKATNNSPQASFHNSESCFYRNNPKERESDSWKPNTVSFPYAKPLGNSGKVLSLKSNRALKKKSSSTAPFPNFASYVIPHQEGDEPDNASVGSASYGSTSSPNEQSGKRRETEIQKQLKQSKSRFDHPSPNYLKATSTSEGKKMQFQASLHDSESSNGESSRNSNSLKPNSGTTSLKSKQAFKRTPSLRPIRISMNKSSFKSKKPSVKNCSQSSEVSSINKATCSSALKDSKLPQHGEETESAKNSLTKVCPYNYCSLHGHNHSAKPALKRVLSKKRRLLKTQKSMKLRRQSSLRGKYPGDIRELIETSQTVFNIGKEEDSDLSVRIYTTRRIEFFRRSSEGNEDDDQAELIFGESLYREKGFQENLNRYRDLVMGEQDALETGYKHQGGVAESTEDNSVVSSASVEHGKNGDSAADSETVGQFPPLVSSEPKSAAEVHKSHNHKRNHTSLWHLIQQHMVSEGAENQLLEGKNEEKQLDETNRDLYQKPSIENDDQDDQEIETRNMYATKVVREAIEKILLPEVEDQSFDDQSSSSEFASEQETLDNKLGEGGKLSISNLTPTNEEEKLEKKTPNSWSNLKKLILLKRFIKALEKVRKYNPPKLPQLPSETKPEAKMILLKPQMLDRKRSSGEWMLDYALQQVVSELAPTQKRKVELLIKAFETMAPTSDEEHIQVPVDGKQDDSASRGQTTKVDGLSGETGLPPLTENQTADDNDKITSSATSFKQLALAGEVTNEDSDPLELLTNMHKQKSTPIGDDICNKGDAESNREKLQVSDITNATWRTTSDHGAEAAAEANIAISSGYGCGSKEEFTKVREQRNRDPELDNKSIQELHPVNDSEFDKSSPEAYNTEFEKEKHVSMWQLIHTRMVEGLAVEGKTKNLHKENEEPVGSTNTFAATESSASCPDLRAWDQSTGIEYHGTEIQEVELRRIFAIKLVREAIEKILLPEVQDQSSDDQSVTSDIISDQELIEKSHIRGAEPRISTSTDSAKDSSMACNSNMVRDDVSFTQESTSLTPTYISESENEKTASKAQSEKKTPKGWTNLKKLILLKRFIKELEKVRKFDPKKPRLLPLKAGAEAAEVSLRRQMMDERKNTEEWMLDYALRKVVAELAPKQKRKVALLVKAFETVAPTSGTPQIQLTFPEFEDTNRECGCGESEQDKFVSEVTEADTKVKDIVTSNLDKGDIHSTISDKESNVPEDKGHQKAAHGDPVLSFHLELLKDGSESTGRNIRLGGFGDVNVDLSSASKSAAPDETRKSMATYNTASSASASEPHADQVIATEEKKKGDPEKDCTTRLASKTQLDKQKHISMWHLLCQHVVSDIATKVESQLTDGEDEDEQVDSPNTYLQMRNGSFHNEDLRSQINGFNHRDAVKLVREAIEDILSPEVQDDSSDAQSVASDTITEQELPETNHGNVEESSIITSIDSPNDDREYRKSQEKGHKTIHRKENGLAADNIPTADEQRTVSMLGNKSDQEKRKNWSKVKKLMLLKRSIKALEKARKPILQATQSLPVKLGKEEEKVDLKHQSKEEKKKAEEWMLDYAVQHIVTKLTPARKRRVSMLVEAFEAVVPMPEV